MTETSERPAPVLRHDLRNRLGVIQGYADLLVRPASGPLTAKQQRYIDNIRTAIRDVAVLLERTDNHVEDLEDQAA